MRVDINKRPWPIATVCGIKQRIDTNPDFQRPAVWSRSQKQLLIDTILRGYDVPKLYWRKVGTKPDKYDVIDGQQRLRAIWDFQSNGYPLAKDADTIDGDAVANLRYDHLPDDLRIRFDTFPLDVIVLSDTDDDEVREMFLRLQNGTSLKAQEKRNAMSGDMREFVKTLARRPFFKNCAFKDSRYTFDHVAAQMTLLELNGGPCNLRDANLNAMYKDQAVFDQQSPKARKVRRVLNYLLECFPGKTPELERYNAVSLYALVSHLLEGYVIQSRSKCVADWFLSFEQTRRAQGELSEEDADPEFVAYHERISHSTDAVDSITWRHEFLMRRLFEAYPDIELKDGRRAFTHEQRMAIYRRDDGICQVRIKCRGVKCAWDDWEADHSVPWSCGGKTIVQNGQVACPACNSTKSAELPDARCGSGELDAASPA